ncbi:AFG1-like ATPase-domain-containing protein [Dendryphion nanum]|uniref:AFG1-like ATPase-domain-containing protein n=1 Tax=Dendryphion nanum TaxID=256645 RepID=A0A9P9DVM6_9PLEO|nr:AFG1-like ATPase-domain-containing protein [Dendryphion nanum]
MPSSGTGLAITNPLVLYRSLLATNRIKPDPAQHRLALQLQKLYETLIDYEPSVEYSQRLKQLSRAVSANQDAPITTTRASGQSRFGTRGVWSSLLAQKEKRDSLALTRVLTSHEAAMNLQSPKGFMLHGEVGTGKSMLIDLFADCLPNRKKKRWHFNTFMLETISRLEALRKAQLEWGHDGSHDEYSLLWLARDLIDKSPVLFLDEFQLPDRAASKILSNLMTSFFQLGGVLIATSNRMPEELAKAAGMEFMRPVSRMSRLGWTLGLGGVVGRDDGPGQRGEFAQFLEVLRARCEIWEMEGKSDYRRLSSEEDGLVIKTSTVAASGLASASTTGTSHNVSTYTSDEKTKSTTTATLPKNYLIIPPPNADPATISQFHENLNILIPPSTPWKPSVLTVYGRKIPIPHQHSGTALFTFDQLCGATLGPADYISLAAAYHTLILTSIPTLTLLHKNEARRLITLLDALYEARCRLAITAATHPDTLFFPEPKRTISTPSASGEENRNDDAMISEDALHPETYSEIHQDLTSPFRPNVSSYSNSPASSPLPSLSPDALEDDPPNRIRRPGTSFTDERRRSGDSGGPDFSNVGGLTGEDERFAVRRAESRIWEMCGKRWWGRMGEEGWWRPVGVEERFWEGGRGIVDGGRGVRMQGREEDVLGSGTASPFRTREDEPPKLHWTHVWGTVKWGKRAGAWGKGVEGLEERRREAEAKGEAGGKGGDADGGEKKV